MAKPRVNATVLVLIIPDPDDQFAPPIYEGAPESVGTSLVVGHYTGSIEDWASDRQYDCVVTVTVDSVFVNIKYPRGK